MRNVAFLPLPPASNGPKEAGSEPMPTRMTLLPSAVVVYAVAWEEEACSVVLLLAEAPQPASIVTASAAATPLTNFFMRFLLTEWFCVDIQLLVTNLHEARCADCCEHSLKLLHQTSFFCLQYYALPFAKSILIYSAEYSVLEFPKIHIFLLVQNIQIAGKTPHKKAFFLLFQVVRPACATTRW